MSSVPPVTERERELEQDLATLTAMYEVCCRQRAKDALKIEELKTQNIKRKILLDLWNALPGHKATGDTADSIRATLLLSEVGDEIRELIKRDQEKKRWERLLRN